jgi:hypothetical protein
MRAAICLVFNDHFKDAEMLSMGVIKDCAGKSRSSKVRATGCGSSSGMPHSDATGRSRRVRSSIRKVNSSRERFPGEGAL